MKRVFCAIFAFLILHANVLGISAQSAVVIDSDTLEILYEKNANEILGMASTTKIMTAIVALENADLNKEITVKKEYTLVEGSSMYLKEGEVLSFLEVLYGLMLMSGNDAAIALAHETTGDYDEFIELMNEKARELGLNSTYFKNPNGLSEEGHETTAFELAKLSAYALENEDFLEIVSSKYYTSESRNMRNHNKLLFMSEDFVGVKTGFTKATGRCLVSAYEKDGKTLICVTLNAPSDWSDHENLLNDAFYDYKLYELYKAGDIFDETYVFGGEKEQTSVEILNDITLSLNSYQEKNLEYTVYAKKISYAPIKKGEIFGEIVYNVDGKEIFKSEILFTEDIAYEYIEEMSLLEKFIDFVKNIFY